MNKQRLNSLYGDLLALKAECLELMNSQEPSGENDNEIQVRCNDIRGAIGIIEYNLTDFVRHALESTS